MGCGAQPPKPWLQPVRRNEGLAQVSPTLIRGKILEEFRILVEQLDDGPLPATIRPAPKRAWLFCAEGVEMTQLAGLPIRRREAREPAASKGRTCVLPRSLVVWGSQSGAPFPDELSLRPGCLQSKLTEKPR